MQSVRLLAASSTLRSAFRAGRGGGARRTGSRPWCALMAWGTDFVTLHLRDLRCSWPPGGPRVSDDTKV